MEILLTILMRMSTIAPSAWSEPGDDVPDPTAPYLDANRPLDERVEDLLARMTLEEKLGQINAPLPLPPGLRLFAPRSPEEAELIAAVLATGRPGSLEDIGQLTRGDYSEAIGPVGGFYALVGMLVAGGPEEQAREHAAQQRAARTETRLGIPLLQITEGFNCIPGDGVTVFPMGPGLGSAFDLDLVERVYAAIAREARATGAHMISPIAEPLRDPRLGRNCETYSECPHLTARIAEAIVAGAQGDDPSAPDRVGVCFAHFPGQSEPASGMERGAMEISPRLLQEVFLRQWRRTLGPGQAMSTMATYAAIDGEVVHGSRRYLTELLRDELGFDGLVVSEGNGFETLQYERVVETQKEAGVLGLRAGVDVNITWEAAYLEPLLESVREGVVEEELVDRAVRRMLRAKFQLGLFDEPLEPAPDAHRVVGCAEHRALALEAAREGIVLLRNEGGMLPLAGDAARVAVVGPNADEVPTLLGDRVAASFDMSPIRSLLGELRERLPQAEIRHEAGCDVLPADGDEASIAAAVEAARGSDLAIVALGERTGSLLANPERRSTVGEQFDVASLDLTGAQERLLRAVVATGTPTVLVLVNGRALSIGWAAEHVDAIVEAWLPGERGAEAIVDVLLGVHNPSGRLPVTVPRHAGQLPAYYNHRESKRYWIEGNGYADMPPTPLFPFGHGLSYTTFSYGELEVVPGERPATATVSVEVANSGARAGAEVVQLYVADRLSSISTPVRELRGFAKVRLEPGERRRVSFALAPEDLALLSLDGRWVVEPGAFDLLVGASAADIRARGELVVAEEVAAESNHAAPARPRVEAAA